MMTEEIKNQINQRKSCKYCNSNNVVKFGTYKGNQRYWCKACQRKFKADDSLFHSRVSPNNISSALIMYYCNKSIDNIRDYLRKEHDYYPSKSVVFQWISKYTRLANIILAGYKPRVGDDWIMLESPYPDKQGRGIRLIDIFDSSTHYLLATFVSLDGTDDDARITLKQAIKTARKAPKIVISSTAAANPAKCKVFFSSSDDPENSLVFRNACIDQLGLFYRIIKERELLLQDLKKLDSIVNTTRRFMIHYNYFKSYNTLNGKTPAQASGITYPYKSWADLIRQPVAP